MPDSDPMTPGEIARALTTIRETVTGIDTKLDKRPTWADLDRVLLSHKSAHDTDIEHVNRTIKAETEDLSERVSELQQWQTWATRLVIGAVIMAVLGIVLMQPPPA